MKTVASAILLALLLSSCGGVKEEYHQECSDAGGEVTVVGSQASCLKDGAVIAKWVESS